MVFLKSINADVSDYAQLFWHLDRESTSSFSIESSTVTPCLLQAFTAPTSNNFSELAALSEQSSPPLSPKVIGPSGHSSLYALIIGINDYMHKPHLKGAINDANAIQDFLQNDLGVPKNHITSLCDGQASRSAIIQAFHDLRKDTRIQMDDPILIYYAGHGSDRGRQSEEEAQHEEHIDRVQALVPQDYCDSEPRIPCIPDHYIGSLINQIAQWKGNNITVIFDCCHAGSGTRAYGAYGISSRSGALHPEDESAHSDQQFSEIHVDGHRGGSPPKDMVSHVLFAACSANESALEDGDPTRGRFTRAFINLLRKEGVDKLLYSDVLKRIELIPNQNPQCSGIHKDRYFFNAKAPPARRVSYPVQCKDGIYEMKAGLVHGISAGAEFTVYKDYESVVVLQPLGILLVENVRMFNSNLKLASGSRPFPLDQPGFALQTRPGTQQILALCVPMEDEFMPVFNVLLEKMKEPGWDSVRISLVNKNVADLEMISEGDILHLNMRDKHASASGFTRIPHQFSPGMVDQVLSAAARYYWHLNQRSTSDAFWQNNIEIEILPLQEPSSEMSGNEWMPEPGADNLLVSGAFGLTNAAAYGMQITNNTKWDLYAGIFFFNNGDLSIESCYDQTDSGQFQPQAPLKKLGGRHPRVDLGPMVQPGDTSESAREVGYLKLFFATKYVDFTGIELRSPFAFGDDITRNRPATGIPDGWGTILIPVIQASEARSSSHKL